MKNSGEPSGRADHGHHGNGVDDEVKFALLGPKGFVCALAILDVGVDSVPFDDVAGSIAQWVGTEQEPPIFSVVATQSRFGLSRLSGSQYGLPGSSEPVQVIGMDRDRPAPILCLLSREAHIVEIVLVEEFGSAVRTRRPRQRGNGVDDELEIALACPRALPRRACARRCRCAGCTSGRCARRYPGAEIRETETNDRRRRNVGARTSSSKGSPDASDRVKTVDGTCEDPQDE